MACNLTHLFILSVATSSAASTDWTPADSDRAIRVVLDQCVIDAPWLTEPDTAPKAIPSLRVEAIEVDPAVLSISVKSFTHRLERALHNTDAVRVVAHDQPEPPATDKSPPIDVALLVRFDAHVDARPEGSQRIREVSFRLVDVQTGAIECTALDATSQRIAAPDPLPTHRRSTAWVLLLLSVGGALSISFLCSILEAALLSVRVIELTARKSRGDRGATLLLDLKQNRIDEAISAILTLNTVAHTVGAAMAGAQAAIVFGDAWVGVFSGVLTLLVLIVTEIIPKTIGTVFASRLVGFVARTIRLLILILWPIVRATNWLTRLFVRKKGHTISRAELAALVAMAKTQGALNQDESRVFDNLLRLNDIRVSDVMTPRTVTVMFPVDAPARRLLEVPEAEVFSRLPLYDHARDNVVGYLVQRDVLAAMARHCDQQRSLGEFRRECMFVPENAPLTVTLRDMLDRGEHLAIVVDEFGAVEGLVTLEDLIETILGVEIVDEHDRVADMREQALRLRDLRMARRGRQDVTPSR